MTSSLPPLNSEHPNAKLIQKFYKDFKNKDYKAMIQAYHPSVEFSDALFDLRGDAAELPDPEVFSIDRPPHHYMHFGYGHHTCLGKYVGLM